MKTNNFLFNLILAGAIFSLILTGCKKDDTTNAEITDNTAIAVAQDGESMDALAENNEQSIDNIVDALEANDFKALKSAQAGGPSWHIDHPDTAYFPKTITLTYAADTTINGESFMQTGTITIVLELTKENGHPWRNYLKRTINFDNFKVASDSASFTINGSRVMTRKSVSLTPKITPDNFLTLTDLRLAVKDSIKANLYFIIKVDSYVDTFSRVVSKTREAIVHFHKNTNTSIWRQVLLQDTLQFNGSISGFNLRNEAYSRVITSPIVFTRCALLVPVISSGTMEITNGTKTATITYSNEGCKTKVILEIDGKTKEIYRKTNRKFYKWW
jgi:hypothetical protein